MSFPPSTTADHVHVCIFNGDVKCVKVSIEVVVVIIVVVVIVVVVVGDVDNVDEDLSHKSGHSHEVEHV
jgi:hypothetical protein